MPIIEIEGDLLTSDCDLIGHGCNCLHTMGSGIAWGIKRAFPEAYTADLRTTYASRSKLGFYSYANSYGKTIVNLYTQYGFGGNKRHLDYEALMCALQHFKGFAETKAPKKIGLPRIGCGLGGGDWKVVKAMIEVTFPDTPIYIYSL